MVALASGAVYLHHLWCPPTHNIPNPCSHCVPSWGGCGTAGCPGHLRDQCWCVPRPHSRCRATRLSPEWIHHRFFFFYFLIKYTLISQGAEIQRSYLHLPRFCSSPVVPANFVHMQNGPMGDIWHPLIFNLENGKKKLNYDKLIYLCSQCCQLLYFSGIFCRLLKSAEQGDKIQRL